jgi:hypothetical protein
MKIGLARLLPVLFLLFCASMAAAQSRDERKASDASSLASASGTVAVIVVKSAARATWATTKFAAKDVAKPIAVHVVGPFLFKLVPKATVFAAKQAAPYAARLAAL